MSLSLDGASGGVLGIDLGTTNTVAAIWRNGRVELIKNREGGFLHPSVVAYTPAGKRLVGTRAQKRRLIDPENTIFSAKRLIGQPFNSRAVEVATRRLPYEVLPGSNRECLVKTRAGDIPVIDISSHVLELIKEQAEAQLKRTVDRCVVTVPAHFTDSQRAATRKAAERAGLDVLRVLNEPTAAALSYGMGRGLEQRVAVFDLGGGTFDVTVLEISHSLFEVLATGGDPFLGGDDMDAEITDILVKKFRATHDVDPVQHRHAIAKLRAGAEAIKIALSTEHETTGTLEEITYSDGGVPLSLDYRFNRQELEECIAPIVARALNKVSDVLTEAKLNSKDIDHVILIGGSTRIPLVRRRVAAFFGREPGTEVDPMLSVAAGAGIHAHTLTRTGDATPAGPTLHDVTGHSIGVVTAGRMNEWLILKNTQIPAMRKRVFTTATQNQTRVCLQIVQGEEQAYRPEQSLGQVLLEGIPPSPKEGTKIEVSFELDVDGILHVSAVHLDSGVSAVAKLSVNGVGD